MSNNEPFTVLLPPGIKQRYIAACKKAGTTASVEARKFIINHLNELEK